MRQHLFHRILTRANWSRVGGQEQSSLDGWSLENDASEDLHSRVHLFALCETGHSRNGTGRARHLTLLVGAGRRGTSCEGLPFMSQSEQIKFLHLETVEELNEMGTAARLVDRCQPNREQPR
jgi:hypothetical protein